MKEAPGREHPAGWEGLPSRPHRAPASFRALGGRWVRTREAGPLGLWAPGQLSSCSCRWEEATGRSASMGTSCREPLEGAGPCLSQGARGSPREAQGWHERQEGRGSGVGSPHPLPSVMAGQALGRSPVLDCTQARAVGRCGTLGHHVPTQAKGDRSTGEAVLGHRLAAPNEAHALLGAGRARSCPERGQRPVPGCRAVPERSRGRQEPEATRATMATRPRGGCEP